MIASVIVLTSSETIPETEGSDHDADIKSSQNTYDPYPLPYFVDDVDRYYPAQSQANTVKRNGELE